MTFFQKLKNVTASFPAVFQGEIRKKRSSDPEKKHMGRFFSVGLRYGCYFKRIGNVAQRF